MNGLKDSLMEGVMDSLRANQHNHKQHPISSLCSTVSSAICQACFASMRSVKACLPTLFCPKPETRQDVFFYESHNNSELTTPLLHGHERGIHNHEPVSCFCNKKHSGADLADANSVDGKLWSLPPLPPVPYQSIPDGGYLQCSTVENPTVFTEN